MRDCVSYPGKTQYVAYLWANYLHLFPFIPGQHWGSQAALLLPNLCFRNRGQAHLSIGRGQGYRLVKRHFHLTSGERQTYIFQV
jgi:hypothetical protein